ncbi:MAG: DUF1552 domain-containing protein [Myxococcaceae bacterium]
MKLRRPIQLSRRTVLRSAVAAIALPALPSLAQARGPVRRFIAIYTPGGVILGGSFHKYDYWSVGDNLARLDMPEHSLHELRGHKSDLIEVRGARWRGYSYGTQQLGLPEAIGHWGELPAFLTGQTLKPNGETLPRELHTNVESIDQMIARISGQKPLNLTVMPARSADTLSCVSWLNGTTADTLYSDPLALYDKLFGGAATGNESRLRSLLAVRRSVLDDVAQQRHRIEAMLSAEDRYHLDAYFTNIRETEVALSESRDVSCAPDSRSRYQNVNLTTNADLLVDLALLALECDYTRVVTMAVWGAGGGTGGQITGSYVPGLSAPNQDFHAFTHFSDGVGVNSTFNDAQKVMKWSAGHCAKFVKGLASKTDSDGKSMLYNSLVMYGSNIGDAPLHEYSRCARILVGQAGGKVRTGRVIEAQNQFIEDLLPEILSVFDYKTPQGTQLDQVGLSQGRIRLS